MPSTKKTIRKPKMEKKPLFSTQEPFFQKTFGETEVFILGTAHISETSVKEVERAIETLKPDVVCVELCESRLKSFQDPHYLEKLDIFKVFRERKMWLLLSNLILSSFQKKMGLGKIKPGEELRTAVRLATEQNRKLIPIDREIQTTLKRSWGNVGFFSKSFLFSLLFTSLFVKEELSPEKIEELKSDDILKDLFSQLPRRYDSIKRVIIDERDIYLAEKIRREALALPKGKVFAVVGAGHLAGMIPHLDFANDLDSLDVVPQKTRFQSLQFLLFPFLFFSLVFGITHSQGWNASREFLISWVLVKGGLAGLGAIIALAHPMSILLAVITAPLGNFNPILKPGWVAGLSESWLRKPLVSDFERIAEDTEHWTGFWKNRVIRIFMVFLLPQIGSSLGTFLVSWSAIQLLF